MGGDDAPDRFKGDFPSYKLGREGDNVTVVVNNNLVDTKIHNVFGVIKGYVDPGEFLNFFFLNTSIELNICDLTVVV